jgi:predicted dehydrogenase
MQKIRILIVGCGHMGYSHAKAYHRIAEFDIVGLVSLESEDRSALSRELGGIPEFDNFDEALKATCPDAVSINTYPDTHAEYALRSIAAGAHVFVEKPLARTVEDAEKVVVAADRNKKKVVVGYILRHHPSWIKFVEIAGKLGKPLVMRMNLNQQSYGEMWFSHKKLLNCLSPIVDCGVHYVDIMCLMTKAKPVSVHAVGARLSSEIKPDMYNYGQLQVTFADGSVGWYEAGWGPMMSETAFFYQGCYRSRRMCKHRKRRKQKFRRYRYSHPNQSSPGTSRFTGYQWPVFAGRRLSRYGERTRSSGTLRPGAEIFSRSDKRKYSVSLHDTSFFRCCPNTQKPV